jgi:hypothetical protein
MNLPAKLFKALNLQAQCYTVFQSKVYVSIPAEISVLE